MAGIVAGNKREMLDNLPEACKNLIAKGIYSLYKIKPHSSGASYIMITPPKTQCCNPHGEQHRYLLSESGNILGEAKDGNAYEIENVVFNYGADLIKKELMALRRVDINDKK